MIENEDTAIPNAKVELTTIRIRKETAASLKELGKKGETYDEVITRLIDRILRRKHKKRS